MFTKLVAVVAAQSIKTTNDRLASYLNDWLALNKNGRCLVKALLSPGANNNAHRRAIQFRAGTSVSSSRENIKTIFSSQSNADKGKSNYQRISLSFVIDSLLSGASSEFTSLHKANSTSSSKFLKTKFTGYDY